MNGAVRCASGAGAGSAATEPRSRAASGLGASAPFHSESRPQRSAAEWRTRAAGWRSEHVWHDERSRRRSNCLPPARTPSAVVPGTASAIEAPTVPPSRDRDRRGNRRARSDRRLERRARAEGIAQTSFPDNAHDDCREERNPCRTSVSPKADARGRDLRSPHGCGCAHGRGKDRAGLRSRCTTKYLPPACSGSSRAKTSPTWSPSW